MTVLEAFAKAFGPLPEGVDGCFVGVLGAYDMNMEPTVSRNKHVDTIYNDWRTLSASWEPSGPNIADRPAESFRGFFGDRYDAVLDEVK